MFSSRFRGALVALAASAGLAACTSYGPYGGSSVGVGVGYGSGYGGYGGYGYGSPYGYGYGSPYYASYPYYGWYDGFYYPGAGYWLYDPWGHRHPITKRQSDYWRNMLEKFREARGNVELKENFSGFEAQARAPATAEQQRSLETIRQRVAAQRAQDIAPPRGISQRQMQVVRQQQMRSERQRVQTEREQVRSERQEAIRQQVIERRQSRGTRKSTDD